jgi:hypothetical protein
VHCDLYRATRLVCSHYDFHLGSNFDYPQLFGRMATHDMGVTAAGTAFLDLTFAFDQARCCWASQRPLPQAFGGSSEAILFG